MGADPPVRILVVEDEFITAADLEAELSRLGYEPIGPVATADEAIRRTGTERPDLVLMDIMLKGPMDGVEAAALIREKHRVPVIFLTANSDDAVLDRAKVSEPFGYLVKPFDQRNLRTNIEMALYKGRMERERALLIEELREALAQVRTLSGLLPICAWCKKVRDDDGYWQQVETFIARHTDARFSHGLCPDCAQQHFPMLEVDM